MFRAVLTTVCVAAFVAVHAAPEDGNWARWRGPDGLGIAASADYPEEWHHATAERPARNIAWKTPLPGRGLSSPIVWGEHLFLTTSIQGEQVPGHTAPDHLNFDLTPGYLHPDSTGVDYKHALKVLAFDTRDGRLRWERTAYDGLMYDNRHRKNTYASPSVVTDGTLVYAFFEAPGLFAYDFDGRLVWHRSLGNIAKAGLGPGTSPILHENLIILQIDQEMGAGSAIVALDKRTGDPVWRAERKNRRSWATPILVRTPNRVELVASGAEAVIAYDPAMGRELWRAPGTVGHPIPSPVAGHGLVFLFAGNAERAKRVLAIRTGRDGDLAGTDAIAWQYTRGTAYVASPILHGKYLYLMTDSGITTCLDAATGEVVYQGGRVPVPASFTASFVAFGDRILQTSEDGDTFVLKAGPTHEIVRTNSVGEPVLASLALARGTIYIRGAQHLFAIRAAEVSRDKGRREVPGF